MKHKFLADDLDKLEISEESRNAIMKWFNETLFPLTPEKCKLFNITTQYTADEVNRWFELWKAMKELPPSQYINPIPTDNPFKIEFTDVSEEIEDATD